VTAATSAASALGLAVDEAVALHASNRLALRLLPSDVLARVALAAHGAAQLEIDLARQLAGTGSPVATLDPRVAPQVYERDGFAITLWTFYEAAPPDRGSPVEYADALQRLHAGMRRVEIAAPHFMERVAEADRLVSNPDATPALAEADRRLLVSTLHDAREQIRRRGAAEQLLHGEPHPGNLLPTEGGLLFIDLESCCRGPIEFDVAHVPAEVSAHYPGVDHVLLEECRRLVLAMVGAWRWDVRDEFPHGHQHGQHILTLLRQGPPWPALGALASE
jgi:hypothetical protein